MSEANLCEELSFQLQKKASGSTNAEHSTSKRSFSVKLEGKFFGEDHSSQGSHAAGNWCEVVSSSLSNVNAKQAWKNGTEKLSQTFNNVRTTFGVLSQKIKKSTKKRQPLVNAESPVTPYTRSRAALGRTPTKLYSPFSIDTPTGKENISKWFINEGTNSVHLSLKGGKTKKKPRRIKLDLSDGITSSTQGESVLKNDLLQTQIGIYEFQSLASRILQNSSNN